MRSINDTVLVVLMAVDKRVNSNTQTLANAQNLSPQQRKAIEGQKAAGESILGDLADLSNALDVPGGLATADEERLVGGTLFKWRKTAQQLLLTTFSAHAKSSETFANRYFGNQALIYAYVVDELTYALETRGQYESLDMDTIQAARQPRKGGILAC